MSIKAKRKAKKKARSANPRGGAKKRGLSRARSAKKTGEIGTRQGSARGASSGRKGARPSLGAAGQWTSDEALTAAEEKQGLSAGSTSEPEDRGAPPPLPTPMATFNI